jgi:hypothetical protein
MHALHASHEPSIDFAVGMKSSQLLVRTATARVLLSLVATHSIARCHPISLTLFVVRLPFHSHLLAHHCSRQSFLLSSEIRTPLSTRPLCFGMGQSASAPSSSSSPPRRPICLILGGGYAGVSCARALDESHWGGFVVLVEKKEAFAHGNASVRGVKEREWGRECLIPFDKLLKVRMERHSQTGSRAMRISLSRPSNSFSFSPLYLLPERSCDPRCRHLHYPSFHHSPGPQPSTRVRLSRHCTWVKLFNADSEARDGEEEDGKGGEGEGR